MEPHETKRRGSKGSTVTAYYWLEDNQRSITLYDDEGFGSLSEARGALTQCYLKNAPTLLVRLAE